MKNSGMDQDDRLPLRRVWDRKRKFLGLTQEIAATRLGFKHPSSFSKYLTHQPINKVNLAIKLACLLEVPLTEIMSHDVWKGVSPRTMLEIAIHAFDEHDLLKLEEMIHTYRRNKIGETTQPKSLLTIA